VGRQMGKEAQTFFREELYRRPPMGPGDNPAAVN
jgi:hypothetical protein